MHTNQRGNLSGMSPSGDRCVWLFAQVCLHLLSYKPEACISWRICTFCLRRTKWWKCFGAMDWETSQAVGSFCHRQLTNLFACLWIRKSLPFSSGFNFFDYPACVYFHSFHLGRLAAVTLRVQRENSSEDKTISTGTGCTALWSIHANGTDLQSNRASTSSSCNL